MLVFYCILIQMCCASSSHRIDPPFGYDLSGQPLPGDLDSSLAGGCLPPSLAQKRKQKQDQKRGRRPDPGRSGALKNATTVQRQRTSYSIFAHQVSHCCRNNLYSLLYKFTEMNA